MVIHVRKNIRFNPFRHCHFVLYYDHIKSAIYKVGCIILKHKGWCFTTNSQAWDYAIGMIKVDGLEPTEDFKKYIEMEKKGEVTMEDAKRFLDKKYKMKEDTNA